jgi:hypothetical protein
LTAASRAPGRWHFLQLTVVMAGWMLLSPLAGRPWLAEAILQAFLLNSAVVTAWSNPQWQRFRWSLLALWGVSLGGSMLALAPLPDRWRLLALAAETVALVPLLVALATGILGYVFRCERMTADSLFAPIVVYVLIALLFARVYVLLIALDPSSFSLPVAAAERGPDLLQADMLYFSLITLATVGYGDILPVSETARMVAVIEATTGQFYVAVIVAAFVGMYAARRRE